jgi:hypothetical protein
MRFGLRCEVCDEIFYPEEGRGQRRKYCSPECQRIGKNRRSALTRIQTAKERQAEKQRLERLKAEKEKNSILVICQKAKKAGMSYGQYVTKYNIR